MTIFRVQVFESLSDVGKWSNVYHVSSTSITFALAAVGATLIPGLAGVLSTQCQIDRVLISDESSDAFIEVPVNDPGTFADSGSLLPLFNSMKVLFTTPGFGRPDLKYIKGLIGESVQVGGELDATFRTAMDVLFTALVTDMENDEVPLCSENGDLWTDVSVQPAVQMRQMHRRRRRTVTP